MRWIGRLTGAALLLALPLCAQFGNNAQKLRSHAICSSVPLNGYALAWNSSLSCWQATAFTATGFTAGAGTLTGPATAGVAATLGNANTFTAPLSVSMPSTGTADLFAVVNNSTASGAQVRVRFDNNLTLSSGIPSGIFFTGGNFTGYPANAFGFWNGQNGPIAFATNNTEKLRLQASGGLSLGASYTGTDPGAGALILSGKLGVGTSTPHSSLAVVGLTVYANNAAAITGGLAAGDFYRTGSDPDMVAVVH